MHSIIAIDRTIGKMHLQLFLNGATCEVKKQNKTDHCNA